MSSGIMNMNTVGSKKMTSRQIAELTGKEHRNVTRDIDNMIDSISCSDLSSQIKSTTYIDKSGISRRQYELDKEMTMTLITGYSIPLRNAVIKRWQELESQSSLSIPDFSDPAAAARAWADKHEQMMIEKQNAAERQAVIEEQRPVVEFVEAITHHSGSVSVAEAAKSIGTGERRLYEFMRQNGWVTRKNVPYQDRVDAGHLDFTRSRYENSKGELCDKYTTRVTEKGKLLLLKRIKEIAPSILDSYRKSKG